MLNLRSKNINLTLQIICFLFLFFLCSCQIFNPKPLTPQLEIPENYSETEQPNSSEQNIEKVDASEETETIKNNVKWWEDFQDPTLSKLIEQALTDNFDLHKSWARLEQTQALAKQAQASFWPHFTLDASAARNRSEISTLNTSSETSVTYSNQFSTSLAASYEIDLWGRISSTAKAADLEYQATQLDLQTIAMSLSAQIAEVWFSILEAKAKICFTQQQLQVNQTYLDLVQLRFARGLVSALDVYQQRQQTAATKSKLPLLESGLKIAQQELALLLGKYPSYEKASISELEIESNLPKKQTICTELPNLPELPELGLPSDLLIFRPDVKAAQLRLASANSKAAAAAMDLFPDLKITALTGFQAVELAEFFETWIWNVLGKISQSLWDGGQETAEVQRTKAVVKEQLAEFSKTVLEAILEVENAMNQEKFQAQYLNKLAEQTDEARKTLEYARNRYLEGLSDYLPVLTALNSLQSLEINLISAKKQLLSYRIQLNRALGGTWMTNLQKPV